MFYRTASLKIRDVDPRLCGKDNKKICNCCETSTCSFRIAAKRLTSIDPNYLYVVVSGLHGDEPNENGDYFEWDKNHFEWEKDLFGYEGELLNRRNGSYVYETWRGKPNLCNHDENSRVGHIEDVFHIPEEKSIDKLLAVDRSKNPLLVKDIEEGRVDGVSMGCLVASSICSKCKHIAYDEGDWCSCLKYHKGKLLESEMVYEINKGVVGQECSWITMGAPADPKARERKIIAKEEEMSLSKIARSKEAGTSSDVVAVPGGVRSAVVYESDMSSYTGIKKSKIPVGLSPEMQAKLAFLEKIPVEKLIGLVDDKTAAELTKISTASESVAPSIDATEELGKELEQINETVPLKVAKELTNEEIAKTIQTHEVTLKSLYAKEKELIGKPESRRVSAEIVKIEDTIADLKKKVGSESKQIMKEEEMDVKTIAKLVRDAVKEEVSKIVKSQMEEDTKENTIPESLEKPEVTEVTEPPVTKEEPKSETEQSLEDLSESIETKLETTPEEADKLVQDIKDVVVEKLETLTAKKSRKQGGRKKGQIENLEDEEVISEDEPCCVELQETIEEVLETTPEQAKDVVDSIEELTEEKLEEKAASKKRRAVRRKAQEAVEDTKEDLGDTLEKGSDVEESAADAVVEEIEDLIETCIEETVSEEDLAKVTVEEEVPVTEEKPKPVLEEETEYTAQFKGGQRKSASIWIVSANKKPIFSVSLKQAFEPNTWDKNWAYFKSEQYGKDLTATLKVKGLKKTLAEDLFEVTRQGQTELPPETPNVSESPGQAAPGVGPSVVTPEAADKILETGSPETSFGKLLTNIIAPIIAITGGTLKVEDIVSELQATFSDTSAASKFKGELDAKVQALSEQTIGETATLPTGATPVTTAPMAYPAKAIKALRKALFEEFQRVKPSMEVSEDEIWKIYSAGDELFKRDLLKEQTKTAALEKDLKQLTAELKRSQATVESLLKERSARFKARKAIELVNKEIEAGWVDSADSLMVKTKCTKVEAEKTAKEIFDHEVDEITSLDDRSFKQISKKLEAALKEEKMGRKASVRNAIGKVVEGIAVSMVEDDKPSILETGKSSELGTVWSKPPVVDENEK